LNVFLSLLLDSSYFFCIISKDERFERFRMFCTVTNWSLSILKDRKMKILDIITAVLIVVGGLNWGLWGAFQFDLVAAIGGGNTGMLARLVYCLVGLSAVYQALSIRGIQSRWHCAAEAK
tara:strand:- start:197 stop:556 length:360 start_codon:yes stop_codon:yes gene_type:complete